MAGELEKSKSKKRNRGGGGGGGKLERRIGVEVGVRWIN